MKNILTPLLIIILPITLLLSACRENEVSRELQNLIADEVNLIQDIKVYDDDSYLAISHGGTMPHTYYISTNHTIQWDIAENPSFTDYDVKDDAIYLLTGASGITGHELIQLSFDGEQMQRFEVEANTESYHWYRMKVLSDHFSFITYDGSQTDENVFFQASYTLDGERLSFNSIPLPGSPFDNFMNEALIGDDGSITIALGSTSGSSLLKFENNELAWSRVLNEGTTRIQDMIQEEQGNFIYTGFEFINDRSRGLIGKVDASGNQLWEKYYATSGDESRFETLVADAQDGYFLVGFNNDDYPDEINKNLWLVKVDENGEMEWQRTHSDTNATFNPQAIAQRSDGTLLVGGALLDQVSYRGFVMAFDQSGQPMSR
ncbi:MAG: hypothetical protein R8G66_07675 [Cytophagales bacterium]|nr:hypothetical protein [Cytophagales bacterium]